MPFISNEDIPALEAGARRIRRHIVEALYGAQAGHPGGTLSAVEIVTLLHFHEMRLRPDDPAWPDRDRFVLSKGHACLALYAALAERGFFPAEMLLTFDHIDSLLQGHPDRVKTPGVEVSAGTLGQGLSVGIGMALGIRMDEGSSRVYVLMGDGELQEGQVWEAAMAAPHYRLDNLVAIVDRNRLQITGSTEDIMPIEPLADRWRDFGWQVLEADGHDFSSLHDALDAAGHEHGGPSLIIAHTVKGKGIDYMENRAEWHSHAISDREYELAIAQLKVEP